MTIASPIMYKAILARDQSYNAPKFETSVMDMWQLAADCPTVEKLFSNQGKTSYILHSDKKLRRAVSEIDKIGQKYSCIKFLGHLEIVPKGSQLEEIADDDSPVFDPEEGLRLYAGAAYDLRRFLTHAMSRKKDIRTIVDGLAEPASKF